MKLSDVQKRLQAPFPAHLISWKPAAYSRDRSRALMLAHIDARCVQDRLDAICPDEWAFTVEVVPGTRLPTVRGRLIVLGVPREDIGEAPEGDLGTLKAATSDALKRCAVHFGIGRYLYDLPKTWADWDDAARKPVQTPELPDWARPDHERTPGGAHLVQAMEQLRYELPEDRDLQREVYRHLKAALSSLNPSLPGKTAPRSESAPSRSPQPRQEAAADLPPEYPPQGDDGPPAGFQGEPEGTGITKAQIQALQGHARRVGANTSDQRAELWGFILGSDVPRHTKTLTREEATRIYDYCAALDGVRLHDVAAQAQRRFDGSLIPRS